MTEIWKDAKGYEGLYKISNHGEVWSEHSQKLLKKVKDSTGYYATTLAKNKEYKRIRIHRLVAINFIDNPLEKPCVNHIDENKTNNHHSNLEWVTYKENMNHGTAIERTKTKLSRSIVGVNINDGKLIEFSSLSEANRNGYHKGNIWACINGRQSIHRGHRWFYKQDYIKE